MVKYYFSSQEDNQNIKTALNEKIAKYYYVTVFLLVVFIFLCLLLTCALFSAMWRLQQ